MWNKPKEEDRSFEKRHEGKTDLRAPIQLTRKCTEEKEPDWVGDSELQKMYLVSSKLRSPL